MPTINELHDRLQVEQIGNSLKLAIADRILECVEEKKNSLGYWQKVNFGHSISLLAENVNIGSHSDCGLVLALNVLIDAMAPEGTYDEDYTRRNEQIEAITYEDLLLEVNSIRNRLIAE